jgi:hypothetical protein
MSLFNFTQSCHSRTGDFGDLGHVSAGKFSGTPGRDQDHFVTISDHCYCCLAGDSGHIFLLGVVDSYSIQQSAAEVKLKLNQFLYITVLDYDDVVDSISEPYGQVKMDRYLWPVGFVDHSVIAYGAHKGYAIPMAKHTVAKMVLRPVTFFVEVVGK